MSGHELTRLANPGADNSAVSKEYVNNNFLTNSGILMEGDINMNNFEITNVLPTHGRSAVSRDFSDSRYLKLAGGTMGGNIDAGGHTIVNLSGTPTSDGSGVNKKYVEDTFAKKSAVVNTDGFTMTGDIDMGGHQVNGLASPAGHTSAISKHYAEANFVIRFGDTMLGEMRT